MNDSTTSDLTVAGVALRFGIVALTLGTAYIHSTLGGLLFTLNATGYAVSAIAMIVPISLAVRFRWLIRLGLMGYAATAIFGWAIQGPYYSTAYVAKGIEVALIFLLVVDFLRADGNPVKVVKREVKAGLAKISRRPPPAPRPPDPPATRPGRPGSVRRRCRPPTITLEVTRSVKRLIATLALATVALAAAACSPSQRRAGHARPRPPPADPNAPVVVAKDMKFPTPDVDGPGRQGLRHRPSPTRTARPTTSRSTPTARPRQRLFQRRDLLVAAQGLPGPGARRGHVLLPV